MICADHEGNELPLTKNGGAALGNCKEPKASAKSPAATENTGAYGKFQPGATTPNSTTPTASSGSWTVRVDQNNRWYYCDTKNYCTYDKPAGFSGDICHLPLGDGHCEAYHPMYYFDSEKKSCRRFIYGGCGGNANKFGTKEACESRCSVTSANTNNPQVICYAKGAGCTDPNKICVPNAKEGDLGTCQDDTDNLVSAEQIQAQMQRDVMAKFLKEECLKEAEDKWVKDGGEFEDGGRSNCMKIYEGIRKEDGEVLIDQLIVDVEKLFSSEKCIKKRTNRTVWNQDDPVYSSQKAFQAAFGMLYKALGKGKCKKHWVYFGPQRIDLHI